MPPPIDYIPAAEALPVSNEAIGEDVEDSEATVATDEIEDDNGIDAPDDEGEEWEDHEDDCILDAPYCGRQMKVFYEAGGWQIGEVVYFNDHLQKYSVKYDDSEDYIGEDEIDMVEVCVL